MTRSQAYPPSKHASSSMGQSPVHALDIESLLSRIAASSTGLSAVQAEARRKKFGANALPTRRPIPAWIMFLRQVANPIVLVLFVAAAISLLTGHAMDAAFIGGIVVINSLIGGFQECRADRSARALQQLLRTQAVVLRNDEPVEIDARELVPGDVVIMESGNRVPADLRLLWAHGLRVDESLLTGESLAVAKDFAATPLVDAPVAEQVNMAFAGTHVISGRAKGLVVATGQQTHVGSLALDVQEAPAGQTPLLLRLTRFTRAIGVVVLIASGLVGVAGVVLHGFRLADMFSFAVALAVSAIPEGLPVAITVALAIAAHRMSRRGVIVRRLHAVEGLGSCTMIASDKTGTLTCNELTVKEICLAHGPVYEVTGEGFSPVGIVRIRDVAESQLDRTRLEDLLRVAVLCNEGSFHRVDGHWAWHGDPTDVALLVAAHKGGIEPETQRGESPALEIFPFEPEHRFAASIHDARGDGLIAVKGAPERVLAMTADELPMKRCRVAEAERMAARGLRVLALASGQYDLASHSHVMPRDPHDLQFLGFVGMIDPLRAGARNAVEACDRAGIQVCMVTGDHPITAFAIARELGLASRPDQVVTGADLELATPSQLHGIVQSTRVFARVSPHQKLQIVEAAKRAGHLVAVTGDGVNDAPALRAANIGVAMGKMGTDVARESADLIISDDNFATIVAGVEEGRIAYDNIRKVVLLLASTGAAEVAMVALAVFAGTPMPLLPVQLLWLNLVTNGIQDVALAFEPGEDDIMSRRPRPTGERVFDRLMVVNTLTTAAVMGGLGFGAFLWMLESGWSEFAARNGLLLLMVLFEFVHIGNCRSERESAFHLSPLRSPFLLFGALGALAIHVTVMHLPCARTLLRVEPVSLQTWLALAGIALVPLVVMELQKLWRRRTAVALGPALPITVNAT